MKRLRLLIGVTHPVTFQLILRGQPRFLAKFHEVHLVTSPAKEFGEVTSEGIPVHAISMQRGISVAKDLISLCRIILLLLQLKPDVVHSYTPKAGLLLMLASWICHVPVRVHTFTGLIWPTAEGFRRSVLIITDRLTCACATHVVPEGLGVLNELKAGGITSKSLRVIGHGNIAGCDTDFFSPYAPGVVNSAEVLRQRLGLVDTDFVYLYAGRLHREKGVDELVQAFLRLPDECHLIIAGEIDTEGLINKHTLKLLRAHPRIHFLGFQSDIRPALSVSNVLVLASYREGFPNVLLQACAMERPVIATDVNGCNEIITPGFNGWLVPAKDIESLACCMQVAKKTTSPDLRAMGMAGRDTVIERFQRNAYLQKLLDFYNSLRPLRP